MIELIVYTRPTDKRSPNYSPFCGKTQAFLKLARLEHKVTDFSDNPGKFKKGKLPVIIHDGKTIEDSYFIQKYCEEKLGVDLDSHLSEADKAQAYAYTIMMEDSLYWSVLWERWLVDNNWEKLKANYFSHMPALIRPLVTGLIRKSVKKSTMGHGMGRHSGEEIFRKGCAALESLSLFLGDKKYFLGDKISSYDAAFYAFMSTTLYCDFGPNLQQEAKKYANLVSYCETMHGELKAL